MRKLALCMLVLAALAPARAGAPAPAVESFASGYGIYVGGIKAGEVTLEAATRPDAYVAEATFRTAGIVAFFVEEHWRGQTEGHIGSDELVPLRYHSRQFREEGDRQRSVTFSDGDPIAVSADPPMDEEPWSIDVADQAGAVDPVTGVLSILAPAPGPTMCDRRIEIYDGKHRFAFDIGPAERDGDRIICEGTHIMIAGYKPKNLRDDRPFKLYLEERDDGLWQAARITTQTPLGTAVMTPRD